MLSPITVTIAPHEAIMNLQVLTRSSLQLPLRTGFLQLYQRMTRMVAEETVTESR